MSDIYRFFNTESGVHFYTSSTVERDNVISNLPVYTYEGVAFSVSESDATASSVYRFLKSDNTHFYTISDLEKWTIQTSNPSYQLEGVAYEAATVSNSYNDTALYRFFNTQTGTHFYTVDTNERDSVLENLPQYSYEGVAYYVDEASTSSSSFSENWYLEAYPDVADAVSAGLFDSGSAHFEAFGAAEGRLGFDDPSLAGGGISINGFVMNGGSGDDRLWPGHNDAHRVFGETGNDTLHGYNNGDILNGGSGDDLYAIFDPGVVITEGVINGGSDTAVFHLDTSTDSLDQFTTPANVEFLKLELTLENGDSVSADRFFDHISVYGDGSFTGTAAAESIYFSGPLFVDGGAGNDTISGVGSYPSNVPSTVLRGGDGVDLFELNSLGSAHGGATFGSTVIADFDPNAGERIDLSWDRDDMILTVADGVTGAVVTISRDVIYYSLSGEVTLTGISASEFQEGWFI
ncbi:hypothetical protein [Nisaea sp.]|uniref:hypothetical protein n=1 Tax=Nisaea sp. TaxID=2024842 RepID=UPI002B27450C|nr:hypothetical protein [Nisaea sp.]